MITVRESHGRNGVKNNEIPHLIKDHIAFTNTNKSLYGFNDIDGNYGVFSYNHHVATFYKDGAVEIVDGYMFEPHRRLLEEAS